MQLRCAFPLILHEILEAYLSQVPSRMYKLDMSEAYHQVTLHLSQVGLFNYIISSVSDYNGVRIFVIIFPPMRWTDTTKFFCTFLEILTNFDNDLIDTEILVPLYGPISDIPKIRTVTPHTSDIPTHIYCILIMLSCCCKAGRISIPRYSTAWYECSSHSSLTWNIRSRSF